MDESEYLANILYHLGLRRLQDPDHCCPEWQYCLLLRQSSGANPDFYCGWENENTETEGKEKDTGVPDTGVPDDVGQRAVYTVSDDSEEEQDDIDDGDRSSSPLPTLTETASDVGAGSNSTPVSPSRVTAMKTRYILPSAEVTEKTIIAFEEDSDSDNPNQEDEEDSNSEWEDDGQGSDYDDSD